MINVMNVNFMLKYSVGETREKCENQVGQKMSFLRKLFSLTGCARLVEEKRKDKQEATDNEEAVFEDNELLMPNHEMLAERLRKCIKSIKNIHVFRGRQINFTIFMDLSRHFVIGGGWGREIVFYFSIVGLSNFLNPRVGHGEIYKKSVKK